MGELQRPPLVGAGGVVGDESRRKRVRKGTRSCWECKRRKIKCVYLTENDRICSGCTARGTPCLSQEFPEEDLPPSGYGGSSNVGERLGRVEQLLERIVYKIEEHDAHKKALDAEKIETPDMLGENTDLPGGFEAGGIAPSGVGLPILSMFDNAVIGRRDTSSHAHTPSTAPGNGTTCMPRITKLDRLREALVLLLPSQEDSDLICQVSNCRILLEEMGRFSANFLKEGSINGVSGKFCFNLTAIAKAHPVVIGRTLLYLIISLQQLPGDFDESRVNLQPSMQARIEKILAGIQALVISDDELVTSSEGVECLVLTGLYHMNASNLRRCWLIFRRALNVSQMMGLHKKLEPNASMKAKGGREMWHRIVQADRYLSLLLGLPCGSADDPLEPDERFDNPECDADQLFARKLTLISGKLIERNQSDQRIAFAATQNVDEKLEQLAKEIPGGGTWWSIPTPEAWKADEADKSHKIFDRCLSQIRYFQLGMWLHLPYMLRANTERKYEYSRFACLKSAREGLWRYLSLRRFGPESFCCKAIDFNAFTGCVTILLTLLDPAQQRSSEDVEWRRKDHGLIQEVLGVLEELAGGGKEAIASQSVAVIKTLLENNSSSGGNQHNLRLTIPYFGTLTIVRNKATQYSASEPSPGTSTNQVSTPFSNGIPTRSTSLSSTHPLHDTHTTQHSSRPQSTSPYEILNPSPPQPTQTQTSQAWPPMINFTSSQFGPNAFSSMPGLDFTFGTNSLPLPSATGVNGVPGIGEHGMSSEGLLGSVGAGPERTWDSCGSSASCGSAGANSIGTETNMQDVNFGQADTMLFDSMLESDIDGGWMDWM